MIDQSINGYNHHQMLHLLFFFIVVRGPILRWSPVSAYSFKSLSLSNPLYVCPPVFLLVIQRGRVDWDLITRYNYCHYYYYYSCLRLLFSVVWNQNQQQIINDLHMDHSNNYLLHQRSCLRWPFIPFFLSAGVFITSQLKANNSNDESIRSIASSLASPF